MIDADADADAETTQLVILDAMDFEGAPVALIHLPHRVPPGFHGNWIPLKPKGCMMSDTMMDDGIAAMGPSEPQRNRLRGKVRAGLLIEVGVNFVLPVLVYDRLKPVHGDIVALLASSLPPLVSNGVES